MDILRLISIENINRLTDLSTTFPLLWSTWITCWSMHETFDLNLWDVLMDTCQAELQLNSARSNLLVS